MSQGLSNIGQAFKSGFEYTAIDTSGLQTSVDDAYGKLADKAKTNEEAAKSKFNATKTQMPDLEGMDAASTGKTNTGVIAQSLQQVGGGAAFARFSDAANPAAAQLREQQKANGYLSKIADGIYQWVNKPALMPV